MLAVLLLTLPSGCVDLPGSFSDVSVIKQSEAHADQPSPRQDHSLTPAPTLAPTETITPTTPSPTPNSTPTPRETPRETITPTPTQGSSPTPTPARTQPPMPTIPLPPPRPAGVHISGLDLVDEWVKITNSGTSPVAMTDWKITDDGEKHTYVFPQFILEAGGIVTLYTGVGNDTSTELYWGLKSHVWNNDGDTAWLYDADGELVDRMEK